METGPATPLERLGLSETEQSFFSSLWITSAEELISASAAVQSGSTANSRAVMSNSTLGRAFATARSFLPESRLRQLCRPRRGGVCGCVVDPEVQEQFAATGRVRPKAVRPTGAFQTALPTAVRLMDRMPPVKNQGERGTCVAFGSVALREYLAQRREVLSEQFLYWACKELDGYPGEGTHVSTAMTALAEYGVCAASVWPYNPIPTDMEGQGPPPPGALDGAKRWRLASTRTVEPNLVVHYKNVLAGDQGRGQMPVTFATLVFRSWAYSPETARTGKVTMPLPGETYDSGHAWCVVGYVDHDHVPGGGYFIVRNSWSERWAEEGPEAPGHAMMPYEYVERYAMEAFTGPLNYEQAGVERETREADAVRVPAADETPVPAERQPFVRVLSEEQRDRDGRLLPAGTQVVYNPVEPGQFLEYTPGNWADFEEGHYAWSAEAIQKVWFPHTGGGIRKGLDSLRSAKQQFCETIIANLETAAGKALPGAESALAALLPWEPKVSKVEMAADLTVQVAAAMRRHAGVPEGVDWPAQWAEALTATNSLQVHTLKAFGSVVHVLVGFVSALRFQPNKSPEVLAPGQELADTCCDTYQRWCDSSGAKKPRYVYATFGSAEPWPPNVTGIKGKDRLTLYSSRLAGAEDWEVRLPEHGPVAAEVRDFLERLKPLPPGRRINRIREIIDEELDCGSGAPVHVKWLYDKLQGQYSRNAIAEAMFCLQDAGDYRLYWTRRDELAIDRDLDRPGPKITRSGVGRKFWK